MGRAIISNIQNTISNGDYVIDGLLLASGKIEIEIEVNSNCDILLKNIIDVKELNIVINRDSNVVLSFISEDEMNDSNINITVKENATLSGYFADFAEKTLNLHCKVNLVEPGASCTYRVAFLSRW